MVGSEIKFDIRDQIIGQFVWLSTPPAVDFVLNILESGMLTTRLQITYGI